MILTTCVAGVRFYFLVMTGENASRTRRKICGPHERRDPQHSPTRAKTSKRPSGRAERSEPSEARTAKPAYRTTHGFTTARSTANHRRQRGAEGIPNQFGGERTTNPRGANNPSETTLRCAYKNLCCSTFDLWPLQQHHPREAQHRLQCNRLMRMIASLHRLDFGEWHPINQSQSVRMAPSVKRGEKCYTMYTAVLLCYIPFEAAKYVRSMQTDSHGVSNYC